MGMNVRTFLTAAVLALVAGPALAQTQRTAPFAYRTSPTDTSAYQTSALSPCYSGTNRTSPCYSGTAYLSYSAITPLEESLPKRTKPQAGAPGTDSLNEDQAKSRIEAKGYSNISGLQKDDHGIWRGKATMKDGRAVAVILDLEGDIYSKLNR
jgi:Peptidase propeptide and YPEB domain